MCSPRSPDLPPAMRISSGKTAAIIAGMQSGGVGARCERLPLRVSRARACTLYALLEIPASVAGDHWRPYPGLPSRITAAKAAA